MTLNSSVSRRNDEVVCTAAYTTAVSISCIWLVAQCILQGREEAIRRFDGLRLEHNEEEARGERREQERRGGREMSIRLRL